MPLRLPLRRRMEPKAEPEFRRRRPPTRQATRLMKFSLGAGLLFLFVLAALFVPRGLFYDRPPEPTATLSLRAQDPIVVEVVRVNVERPLAEFQAELNITGGAPEQHVPMNPLEDASWAGGIVAFDDADGDGALSVGDTFTIQGQAGPRDFRLLIFHESAFVNPQSPCPCAAARIAFHL